MGKIATGASTKNPISALGPAIHLVVFESANNTVSTRNGNGGVAQRERRTKIPASVRTRLDFPGLFP